VWERAVLVCDRDEGLDHRERLKGQVRRAVVEDLEERGVCGAKVVGDVMRGRRRGWRARGGFSHADVWDTQAAVRDVHGIVADRECAEVGLSALGRRHGIYVLTDVPPDV